MQHQRIVYGVTVVRQAPACRSERSSGHGDGSDNLAKYRARALPIFQKRCEPLIRQWVFEKLLENFERHGANVDTHSSSLDHMQRVAQAGGQDLP